VTRVSEMAKWMKQWLGKLNRHRNIEISTKANSREPAYSQALIQNKINTKAAGQIQRVRQAGQPP